MKIRTIITANIQQFKGNSGRHDPWMIEISQFKATLYRYNAFEIEPLSLRFIIAKTLILLGSEPLLSEKSIFLVVRPF